MFDLKFPTGAAEWLPLIVPLITFSIGFLFFFAPGRMLGLLGLAAVGPRADAVGEGRSRFAGFLIGLPVAAFLFDQPVLFQTIGIAWGLAATGKLVHIVFDRARGPSVHLRFAMSAALCAGVLVQSGLPAGQLALPVVRSDWLVAAVAAATALAGAAAFLFPSAAVKAMRLAPRSERGAGEVRGGFAGFYIATGVGTIVLGGVFLPLALGVAWLFTAFGRMISMLSDRANNPVNWLLLVAELALGAIPLAAVFGFLQ